MSMRRGKVKREYCIVSSCYIIPGKAVVDFSYHVSISETETTILQWNIFDKKPCNYHQVLYNIIPLQSYLLATVQTLARSLTAGVKAAANCFNSDRTGPRVTSWWSTLSSTLKMAWVAHAFFITYMYQQINYNTKTVSLHAKSQYPS